MSDANTVTAKSWEHLMHLLTTDSWDDQILRHRTPFVYRGLADASWGLSTTLYRLHNGDGDLITKLERNILRNFEKYAYNSVTESYSHWYWLSVAQHHGLPTRLLDWSGSPLVALHFATNDVESYHDKDALIWCIDVRQIRTVIPVVAQRLIEANNSVLFTIDMLEKLADSIHELDEKSLEYDTPFVLFFEPPSLDQRIVNQAGLFSVMSNPTSIMSEWILQHPTFYKKITIPAKLKWEVRNKLDFMNMNERTLFPGLDGLSSFLKRYYGPAMDAAQNTESTLY